MFDLQSYLDNAVAKMRADTLKGSPQILLGELIAKLESCDPAAKVRYDFDKAVPTTLHSWRGIYAELSLDFDETGTPPTVADLLEELRGAVGKTYGGYKGGDFVMGKGTPVWVAHWGDAGNRGIVGVEAKGKGVILKTAECES